MKQAPYADQLQYSGDLFTCLIFLCPTQEFFTHMEMSPSPVKGRKF